MEENFDVNYDGNMMRLHHSALGVLYLPPINRISAESRTDKSV